MNPRRPALTYRNHPMRTERIHSDQAELPHDLKRIDDLLASEAARWSAPSGLSDRVFAASRPHLVAGRHATADSSWRLVGADGQVVRTINRSTRRMTLGRLAMAASIAVIFAIAGRTLVGTMPTDTANSDTPLLIAVPISDKSELELSLQLGDEQTGAILTARDFEYDDLDRELQALNVVLSSNR